jgi:hypothetical protein
MAVPKASAADAAAAATAAAAKGRAELLAASTAWWRAYWEQSFVTLPVTRAEGFYYTQMYRFVSSDRVGLHGRKKHVLFVHFLYKNDHFTKTGSGQT